MKVYEGFKFNVYFKKFLDSNGITQVKVSGILGISYNTFIAKIRRDSFSYSEILFLEKYYSLGYVQNFNNFLELRGFNK